MKPKHYMQHKQLSVQQPDYMNKRPFGFHLLSIGLTAEK